MPVEEPFVNRHKAAASYRPKGYVSSFLGDSQINNIEPFFNRESRQAYDEHVAHFL